jgi:hypothetical protein
MQRWRLHWAEKLEACTRMGVRQVLAVQKSDPASRGSQAAEVSGYEHEYALTDLMQPGA